MAEDRCPDRPADKADEEDCERLQHADDRIRLREEELAEDQPRHLAVKQKIVPFDRRADRAGYKSTTQLPAVLGLGDPARGNFGCCHCNSLPDQGRRADAPCPYFSLIVGRSYRSSSRC